MTEATSAVSLGDRLKRVLRFMPAPVGIVTATNPTDDMPVGLAVSAIMPIALDPCSMAVAVNRSGSAHEAMLRSGRFCINLLDEATSNHLAPFASSDRREERFRLPGWERRGGDWYIKGAPANIFCTIIQHVSYGTHDILLGAVEDVIATDETAILGWCNGKLGTVLPFA